MVSFDQSISPLVISFPSTTIAYSGLPLKASPPSVTVIFPSWTKPSTELGVGGGVISSSKLNVSKDLTVISLPSGPTIVPEPSIKAKFIFPSTVISLRSAAFPSEPRTCQFSENSSMVISPKCKSSSPWFPITTSFPSPNL